LERDFPGLVALEGDKRIVAVKEYLVALGMNLRSGNFCVKERDDISDTGKKPHHQKGTGVPRHGSTHSSMWAGGGVVFGPKPRAYWQIVNK
jgi:large subunit ribosomal protein L4